jgi:hypothetical protein
MAWNDRIMVRCCGRCNTSTSAFRRRFRTFWAWWRLLDKEHTVHVRLPPVLCVLLAVATPASPQTEGKDPSPHVTRLVNVEDGVQLEVLDWSGSPRQGSGQAGPPLVLLPGLGSTAHHYDDLAQALTSRYRVIAVTRRGHRGSSAAPAGYGQQSARSPAAD